MRANFILFFVIGLLFGCTSIILSTIPKKSVDDLHSYKKVDDDGLSKDETYKTTITTTNFDNAGMGALANGIIAASCFIAAANIAAKKQNNIG